MNRRMDQTLQFPRKDGGIARISLVAALAFWVLASGGGPRAEFGADAPPDLRRPTGFPQLVSVEPMPRMEGQMCKWMPARASASLAAALVQERMAGDRPAMSEEVAATTNLDRPPLRVIRDNYPTYSAIAVDLNSSEVYLQDENLYGYKVFNRMDNTPPTATMTEPKRTVAGIRTKMEFNCGLYVDPTSGDVYSVNNDTLNTMTVFPREANGNVAPKRALKTPHGTYGIAVDEESQELFLTVEHSNSITVFRKMAQGQEKPIRTVEGNRTQLEDPHGIALDRKNQWIFVANYGNARDRRVPGSGQFEPPSITVYPLKASGNVSPLRTIEGPKTQLNWPAHLYMDAERGELYVANDAGDSVLVFRATDSGDAAPARVLHGPKTGIKNPTGVFVDPKNEEVWVANMGNHSATVYRRSASGDVPPLRTIRSAPQGKVAQAIGNPGAVSYDTKREEILVPN